MNYLIDTIDKHSIRALSTLAIIVGYGSIAFDPVTSTRIGAPVVIVMYCIFIWLPRERRSLATYIGLTAVVIGVIAVVSRDSPGIAASLAWPLIGFLGFMSQRWTRISFGLAGATLICTIILTDFSHFSFGLPLGLIGTYLAVRNREIRREANAQRRRDMDSLEEAHRELQHAHEELQLTTAQSIRYAAMAERTRIARDIHDVLGHNLTSLIVQLQAVRVMLPNDVARASKTVDDALQIARTGMSDVREAVREWSTDEAEIGSTALRGLLSQTESTSGIQTAWVQRGATTSWSLPVSATLYRILQESLTNAMKHADATLVRVELEENEGTITMDVIDNGKASDITDIHPSFGLRNMEVRCASIGGGLTLTIHPPHGLHVRATVPARAGLQNDVDSDELPKEVVEHD